MVRLVFVVLVTTVLGLLAVAEQLATVRQGYEIEMERRRLESLLQERRQLELVVARLSTPEALQSRAATLALNLSVPDRPRVVRVRPRASEDHAYAQFDRPGARTAARER